MNYMYRQCSCSLIFAPKWKWTGWAQELHEKNSLIYWQVFGVILILTGAKHHIGCMIKGRRADRSCFGESLVQFWWANLVRSPDFRFVQYWTLQQEDPRRWRWEPVNLSTCRRTWLGQLHLMPPCCTMRSSTPIAPHVSGSCHLNLQGPYLVWCAALFGTAAQTA